MAYTLRNATEGDWEAIHSVANAALPWSADGNQEWLANRQRFELSGEPGRDYVAQEDDTGQIGGYAAVEGDSATGRFRVFVVAAAEVLNSGLGQLMYDQLVSDLEELGATTAWAREEARDLSTIGFLQQQGFTETQRVKRGETEMLVLEKLLSQHAAR